MDGCQAEQSRLIDAAQRWSDVGHNRQTARLPLALIVGI
jgi:hypothetical protein